MVAEIVVSDGRIPGGAGHLAIAAGLASIIAILLAKVAMAAPLAASLLSAMTG